MGSAQKAKAIEIERPQLALVKISIEGSPPGLLMHRFGAKAKNEMREKQGKAAKTSKPARDPEAEVEDAIYRLAEPVDGVQVGFPAHAFKDALISAAQRYMAAFKKQSPMLRGAIFIKGYTGQEPRDGQLVPVHGAYVDDMRTVRIGSGSDLRYRPHFPEWTADLEITLDTTTVSVDQLYAMTERAGVSVGVGDGRVEKSTLGFGGWRITEIAASE
ncbi:MAG: hypothetical protein GF320_21925 [Armatimonadia bacterium]|nr:hypothetical protein [Armatimonadia bacterium]